MKKDIVHTIVKYDQNGNVTVYNSLPVYRKIDDALEMAFDLAYGDYYGSDPDIRANRYGDAVSVYIDGYVVARYDIYAHEIR